ncbi:hypothetical protein KP77_35190 [Jeotgalibacillus alimentarius]|uniref:Transposase n=1 Tax=Jeotgalibacillus alimentarius TaxID=135826 RepID=A0A0C2RM92_9BACL|nr:hypothetical protein KP77_35190 [Jeotgalibacillus alimentarius]
MDNFFASNWLCRVINRLREFESDKDGIQKWRENERILEMMKIFLTAVFN